MRYVRWVYEIYELNTQDDLMIYKYMKNNMYRQGGKMLWILLHLEWEKTLDIRK